MAAAGIDSRRNCEQIILDGAVRVNRKLVDTLPAFVDPETDVITVNGRKIRTESKCSKPNIHHPAIKTYQATMLTTPINMANA